MLIFLASALVCIASVSAEEYYGRLPYNYNPKSMRTPPPSSYQTSEEEPPRPYPWPHGTYQYTESCRDIHKLKIHSHRTARAEFFTLTKDDHTITTISCPNSGKAYALIAEKEGADTAFELEKWATIEDTIVLATGFNLDYSAKCFNERIVGRAFNGREVTIKKVACVELREPKSIKAL